MKMNKLKVLKIMETSYEYINIDDPTRDKDQYQIQCIKNIFPEKPITFLKTFKTRFGKEEILFIDIDEKQKYILKSAEYSLYDIVRRNSKFVESFNYESDFIKYPSDLFVFFYLSLQDEEKYIKEFKMMKEYINKIIKVKVDKILYDEKLDDIYIKFLNIIKKCIIDFIDIEKNKKYYNFENILKHIVLGKYSIPIYLIKE